MESFDDIYNIFLQYPSVNNPNAVLETKNWMGSEDEPLKGFSWKSGTKRDTTGIVIWSDAFLHTVATTGEKISIFIMDTQGMNATKELKTLEKMSLTNRLFRLV